MSDSMPVDRDSAARQYMRAERGADVREAAQLLQLLAEPLAPREKVQLWIRRAAARANFDLNRAEDIWRKDARRIDAWEMDTLRAAVRAQRRAPK